MNVTRGRGRIRLVKYSHVLRVHENEGAKTMTSKLIHNLEKLELEYGGACVTDLIKRQLIGMTYEEMVSQIAGRQPVSGKGAHQSSVENGAISQSNQGNGLEVPEAGETEDDFSQFEID